MKNTYRVIGLMSGSSMDGVDVVGCELSKHDNQWHFAIIAAETFPYEEKWRVRLSQLYKQNIEVFPKTNVFYGRFLGHLVNHFIRKHGFSPDLIASHGHTIYHQPEAGFTAQIGDGAAIAAETNLPVVCDFRSMDLSLGGQGAPLVPVGDALLFPEYAACLNLGGISNISFREGESIHAFDISPCNIVLNRIARWMEKPYDDGGAIAASAEPDSILLEELNALPYYAKTGAKSLGREWINQEFWPLVKAHLDISEPEKMATLSLHIATQIAHVLNANGIQEALVTGGGAYNTTLIRHIQALSSCKLTIPDNQLVNFKEALIFAFLGLLRIRNEHNVLSEVTGSKRNHIGGALYGDFSNL